MMNARIAVSATLIALLAGCGTSGTTAEPPARSKPADPRETLTDAVPDDEDGAFRFAVKGGTTPSSGVVAVAEKAAEFTVVQHEPDAGLTLKMDSRIIGGKVWVRLAFTPADLPGLSKLPKKWLLMDPAKAKDLADLTPAAEDTDPGYVTDVLENAAAIVAKSTGHFAGTTDLSKYNADADVVDEATLKALGAKAKAIPFRAVVEAGHLTSLTLAIPAAGKAKAQTYAVSYTGFGKTPVPVAPAPADQQKATAEVYDLMNS